MCDGFAGYQSPPGAAGCSTATTARLCGVLHGQLHPRSSIIRCSQSLSGQRRPALRARRWVSMISRSMTASGRGPGLHRLRRQPHHAAAGTLASLASFCPLLSRPSLSAGFEHRRHHMRITRACSCLCPACFRLWGQASVFFAVAAGSKWLRQRLRLMLFLFYFRRHICLLWKYCVIDATTSFAFGMLVA